MAPVFSRAINGTRGTLDWDSSSPIDGRAMAIAALGIGVPVLVGLIIGDSGAGLAAAVGAMWVAGTPRGSSFAENRTILRAVLAAALAAAIIATAIAQHRGWSDLWLVLATGVAALAGGFSRPMAAASRRFVVFVTIGFGIASHAHDRLALMIVLCLGAVWAAACALAIGCTSGRPQELPGLPLVPAPFVTAFRRWCRKLATFAGWNYAARLTFCLGAAVLIRVACPQHHYGWIAVAVVLLSQRRGKRLTIRVAQRSSGVAAGVLACYAIASGPLANWALVATIAGLAALGPLLRTRSYAVYSAAATPLILLLTSGGKAIGPDLLIDRLVATLIAAALVIFAYFAAEQIKSRPLRESPRSR